MKKYYLPILALCIDVSIYSFQPESTGIRLFFQVVLYSSLMRILVSNTFDYKVVTNTLLRWTLGIGLILPIFLVKTDLLFIDQFYIADMVILVPILFNELMKKSKTDSRLEVTPEVNDNK